MSIQLKRFYTFGPFRLDSGEQVLLRDGHVVPLTPKVAETLLVLVENAGHVVGKDELMRRVWPDAFVEEGNLSKNIYTLRKLLGQSDDGREYIETLSKRGYRFITPVTRVGSLPDEGEFSGQPATEPENRVTSIGGGLGPLQKATRMESAGASGTAILTAVEAASRSLDDEPHGQEPVLSEAKDARATVRRRWAPALTTVGVLAAAAGSYFHIHSRPTPKLTNQDTVVLADFTNTTGDPVFDGALRQGLSAQLEQSPFLNLLSDDRIAQTLALMTQPKDARLTHNIARQVCQRTASTASIEGSIAGLGSQYVLGLKAVNCRNGDLLADEQETANGKERVIKALGEAATKMRRKLGESLASVEKYDAPPERVTTPSLEALRAYSLGRKAQVVDDDWTVAVRLFERAASLDPNFAMAYARLAVNYSNVGENARAAENAHQAYDLRDRVSEREKFYIGAHYEQFVTGNLEAAARIYELWTHTYPRDVTPLNNLGTIYQMLGDYDSSLAARQASLSVDPENAFAHVSVIDSYLHLDRQDEAKATAQQAAAHNLDSPYIHYDLYYVDFLEGDRDGMQREADKLLGKAGYEDWILDAESDTAAYAGQFRRARELTRQAVESAEHAEEKETAANYISEAALREALVGNGTLAPEQAQAALALSNTRDVEAISAIALGLAGEVTRVAHLANDLDVRFSKDTMVRFEYLPMIRASALLGRGDNPKSAREAVDALAPAVRYELGMPPASATFELYPAYLRGQAYLEGGQGGAAAAEFKKILDHPGIVENGLIGALAQLGMARAHTREARGTAGTAVKTPAGEPRGGTPAPQSEALAKARTAYQDFLALWRDADPDIPILKQAKAEYAKLK